MRMSCVTLGVALSLRTLIEFEVQETERGRQVSEIIDIGSPTEGSEESLNQTLLYLVLKESRWFLLE